MITKNYFSKVFVRPNRFLDEAGFSNDSQPFVVEQLEDKMMLSTVDIYAAGATGNEVMDLLIDGQVVQSYSNVSGSFADRQFEKFRFQADGELSADQISVRFANDVWDPSTGYDQNLFVNKIVVDGVIYHSEHSATNVTAHWNNGIQSGNLRVETLNVNGQFDFSSAGAQKFTNLVVSANGDEGSEIMQILVDDEVVGEVQVSQETRNYSFDLVAGMSMERVKVQFSNDDFRPDIGYDRNLNVDYVELFDLESGESVFVSTFQYGVFSTGTWRPDDGIVEGFGRGTTLHTNGFFAFTGVEDRTIDGTRNNITTEYLNAGSAETALPRFNDSNPQYSGDGLGDQMISDVQRANPRDISNIVVRSESLTPSSDNLSDMVWLWGQFLDHDIDLSTGEHGPDVNGSTVIAINNPNDPLGPRGISFTRSDFEVDENGYRQQINAITSFIDASNVYGSDAQRANALRTFEGGRLRTGANGMLPTEIDVPNEDGGTGRADIFVAGDVRANENVGLASLHTLFVREHNRLANIIADQNPGYSDEEIYQMARKVVGAQIQIITYNEFLPVLLGDSAPNADSYEYDRFVDPAIVNSFAHAAYRFGHSMLSPSLQLALTSGEVVGAIPLKDAFFNPGFLIEDPSRMDLILQGMMNQRAQEIDANIVEDVRSFLFGRPGAGGLDLASLNIQRGRDHGIPDYNSLREIYGLGRVNSFADITSNIDLQGKLATAYGNVNNIDAWVGGLAEDHLAGANMGELLSKVIGSQFERLRDGDRLFYTSNEAGLYQNGQLRDEIKSIIDLDSFSLAEVLNANASVAADDDPFRAPIGQTLVVNAFGSEQGGEFRVIVDGRRIATFQTSTLLNQYQVAIPQSSGSQDIQIEFFTDRFVPGESDLNLVIESIEIAGSVIPTDSSNVFSTGTWRAEDGIVSGFGRGDTLHANGYFQFVV